jgi:hypothetical protein
MPQPVLDLGSNLEENMKGGRTSSRVGAKYTVWEVIYSW